jgi:hypothetical protein
LLTRRQRQMCIRDSFIIGLILLYRTSLKNKHANL